MAARPLLAGDFKVEVMEEETVQGVPGVVLKVTTAAALRVTSRKGQKTELISRSEKHVDFLLRDVS